MVKNGQNSEKWKNFFLDLRFQGLCTQQSKKSNQNTEKFKESMYRYKKCPKIPKKQPNWQKDSKIPDVIKYIRNVSKMAKNLRHIHKLHHALCTMYQQSKKSDQNTERNKVKNGQNSEKWKNFFLDLRFQEPNV